MGSDLFASVFSFAGWAFLPRYATSFLQSLYYRITIRAGEPHPAPGSPRYVRHYRRIYIVVVTSYLLYSFYDTYHKLRVDGDFYQLLGVLPTADDRTIKSRFRRLAALHHPDKRQQIVNNSGSDESPDALFLQLRLAQDTLLDPVKKFAYDRFGQAVVEGSKAKTISEFLYAGLYALAPQYVGGFIVMTLMNLFWFSGWGRYWRFYTFFALLTLELTLLTHPKGIFMPANYLPPWLSSLLRLDTFYLVPFQILALARSASMTTNIFISQLTPPNDDSSSSKKEGNGGLTQKTQTQLAQLTHMVAANDAEVTRLLQMAFAPFRGDKESVGRLRRGMKEGLILGSVREAPEVKEAVKGVVERRRKES
ncbi:hypothetical protein AJ79_08855 [Helicocarpus griseus UAMH5409]|uniref:J domain-containing protein n=1 Tax=Helicocarpus griseus UAMH5409 TaxID=1447875 RepID=A0A2B7WGM4_9EURO|nr:hypothetical protein AJ79_08855 [Helicocarpus griseus UAMH5409]